jgi:hypothetical protein
VIATFVSKHQWLRKRIYVWLPDNSFFTNCPSLWAL